MTLQELLQRMYSDVEVLEQIYEDSIFDGDKLGGNKLTYLIKALDISNILNSGKNIIENDLSVFQV